MIKSKSRLAIHFGRINALYIIVILLIFVAVGFLTLSDFTDTVSKSTARFYSIETVGRLNSYLNREIALLSQAARSANIYEWFADEENPEKKTAAYQTMMEFIPSLQSRLFYFAVTDSFKEYILREGEPFESFTHFNVLDPMSLPDEWFFNAITSEHEYLLNIDVDVFSRTRHMWINHHVRKDGNVVGILCTSLQFDEIFRELFESYDNQNVAGFIIDGKGFVQINSSETDPVRRRYEEEALYVVHDLHILDVNPAPQFASAINSSLDNITMYYTSRIQPSVTSLSGGQYRYLSIAPIPNTDWMVVTLYDSRALFDATSLLLPLIVILLLFVFYTLASHATLRRLVFTPLDRFTLSVLEAGDNCGSIYGTERNDEIGELARTTKEVWNRLNEAAQEREQLTHSLRVAADEANAASNAKSAFLAHMSHEIRTPMNSIIGFSELALDGETSPRSQEYLEKILENADGLLQIINDVLDLSKVEAGKMEIENVPFNLHDLFLSCRTLIIPKAAEKCITLHFYAEPSVGKMPVGDPTRLRQILVNLLSNAVKFTNTGIVKLLAEITAKTEKTVTIRFEVRDTGIGMTERQIEKIFEPFIQGEIGTTRKFGGTGLGLAITKSMVELMGGTLSVESTVGLGSKFNFEIIFETLDVTSEDLLLKKIIFNELEKPMFKGEVLLCEDNVMNQQVIQEHLARVGLKTVVAGNGKIGVELLTRRIEKGEKPFDLIFMDIHMPVMDGLEAARKILKLNTGVPIIALTANIMSGDREVYRTSGMDGYVGKPFTSQELWRCLVKYFKPVSWQPVNGILSAQAETELRYKYVNTFLKDNQNRFDEIIQAIDTGDIKLAHRLAHSLKGNAGQLGKTFLQKAAASVEEGLKNGNNLVTEKQLKALETELEKALVQFTAELDSGPPLAEEQIEENQELLDAQSVLELTEKLEQMLEMGNPECRMFIGKLRRMPGNKALIDQLIQQIDDLDFEQALAALVELKKEHS